MSSVERIASLLAMAERTDNAEEADAFLSKAQTLATLHSIDLALAQAKIASRERRQQPINKHITVGERGKRANKHMVSLFSAIATSNDVKIDIAHNSTYLVAFGFEDSIATCEALWGSLAHQMVTAANAYIAAGEWRTESYTTFDRNRWEYVTKPLTAQVARASFYKGYIARISDRLAEARAAAVREADAGLTEDTSDAPDTPDLDPSAPSAALVLKAKADEVDAHYKENSRARGTWGGYRGAASSGSRAGRAGRTAANSARLSAAKGIGSNSGAIG